MMVLNKGVLAKFEYFPSMSSKVISALDLGLCLNLPNFFLTCPHGFSYFYSFFLLKNVSKTKNGKAEENGTIKDTLVEFHTCYYGCFPPK